MSIVKNAIYFTAGMAAMAMIQQIAKEAEGKEGEGSLFTGETFDELIQNQAVFEEVDGSSLSPWFREHMAETDRKQVFFLCKLTEEIQTIFAIKGVPENLDTEHYLLQVAVDEKTKDPTAVRLVSLSTMAESLEDVFADKDFVIVKGE